MIMNKFKTNKYTAFQLFQVIYESNNSILLNQIIMYINIIIQNGNSSDSVHKKHCIQKLILCNFLEKKSITQIPVFKRLKVRTLGASFRSLISMSDWVQTLNIIDTFFIFEIQMKKEATGVEVKETLLIPAACPVTFINGFGSTSLVFKQVSAR